MKKPLFTVLFSLLLLLAGCSSDDSTLNSTSADPADFEGSSDGLDWVSSSVVFTEAASDKKAMIYFTSNSCEWGDSLELKTFTDETVMAAVNNNFYPVYINTSSDSLIQFFDTTLTGNGLFKDIYNLVGVPSILILDEEHQYDGRIRGYMEPAQFIDELNRFVETAAN